MSLPESVPVSVQESSLETVQEKTSEAESVPPAAPVNGFEAFDISEPVMKSLIKMGYTAPTEVQNLCLPHLLASGEDTAKDIVALARTGTGKTAAFGIPLVEAVDTNKRVTQALVLCPTRELCQQVATSISQIGQFKRVKVLSIYGGDSYRRQFEGLAQGPHIVVATPGRLIDLLSRSAVDLKSVETLVLDEADEMISVGFREALTEILQSFSDQPHRTWLFSATMSADVKRVQSRYIKDAKMVDATRGHVEKPLIRQQYMLTYEEDRLEALKRYLHVNDDFYGLIFCQTKAEVASVESALKAEGFKVDALHGDKVQREREAVFAAWKKKQIKIVVATDVAARGLDVQGLTHVINMSIPREDESYVHRIGRTGRAGREGIALSFVWPKRANLLRLLERKLGVTIEQVPVPEPMDVARAVLGREITKLFGEGLEFKEGSPIQKMIADLITGLLSKTQTVDEKAIPLLAALTARILEHKHPGLLDRPFVKVLRADGPGVSHGYGGRGGPGGRMGGRPGGRFGGRPDSRPMGRPGSRPEPRSEGGAARAEGSRPRPFARGEAPRPARPMAAAKPEGPRFRDMAKPHASKPHGVKPHEGKSRDGGFTAPRRKDKK